MSIAKPAIPFYAAVGAGDALVEKVRTTDPSQFKAPKLKAPHVTAPQLSDVTDLPAQIKALPEHLRELQEQAQAFATDTLGQLSTAYTGFAKRGETVVDDVRKRDVVADVKGAVSKLQGVARPGSTAPVADEAPAAKPAADKPSAAKPAAKKAPASKSTASKSTTSKSTAKGATKKTTAKKSSTPKSSTAKSTTDKSE